MECISDVESRLCLAWTTKKPYVNIPRQSASFSLFNAKWHFLMMWECADIQRATLYLRQKIKLRKLERSFRVTTFIENVDQGFASLRYITAVESTCEVIWQFNQEQISENFSGCLHCGHWRIICIFHNELTAVPQNENRINRKDLDLSVSFGLPPELERLSSDFTSLLKYKALSDVMLRCGDHTIRAHRAVLAARSEVFATMFRTKMTESETGVVDITDLDAQTLDLLLKYIYSGKLEDLSKDIVPSLYAAGDKYAMHGLKKVCSDWIIKSLTEENCPTFFAIADAHSDVAFKNAVLSFICAHEEVFRSKSWLKFSEEYPKLSNVVYRKVFRFKRRKQ